ncbi:hypothetical protein D3C71_539450 [compost metagenome]
MADLLKDFETYFNAQNLLGGYKCSFDGARDSPAELIMITEYIGSPLVSQIDGAVRSIQILVRDKQDRLERARDKAHDLFNSLRTADSVVQLTALRWGVVTLRNAPIKVRTDTGNRVYYGFNLAIVTYLD